MADADFNARILLVSSEKQKEQSVDCYVYHGHRDAYPGIFPEGRGLHFFSFSVLIMMILLAAPRIERLPAIVLPAARAIISSVAAPR